MKEIIRSLARASGYDIRRFQPDSSDEARLRALLAHQAVDLVLDVGANAGQYGALLRKLGYAGRIVSFEPLSAPHAALSAAASGDAAWTVADRMAIGDRDGTIEINVSENSASSSILPMHGRHLAAAPQSQYVSVETVPIRTLASVAGAALADARRPFLKIDTQGYESQVLDGAAAVLPRIQGLQLELSLVPLYEGQALYREVIERLTAAGFELHAVLPGFSDNRTGRMMQMDGVFFRADAAPARD